jgi:hypothetical protein
MVGSVRATAWILDVGHRATRLACDVPPGQRALAAIKDAAQRALGIAPDLPLGVRELETAPELLFLVPRGGQRFGVLAVFGRVDPET